MLFKQSRQRVTTGQLNRAGPRRDRRNPPPVVRNRRPKIYYATQVGVQPPTIVLFCNNPTSLSKHYQRYLLGVFRDELDFGEVPIKLYLRKRLSATAATKSTRQLPPSRNVTEMRIRLMARLRLRQTVR